MNLCQRFHERLHGWIQWQHRLGLLDEWLQCMGLATMPHLIKQVTEPADGRVFVCGSRLCQSARVGLGADVLGDLRDAVNSRFLVKVACTVEQRQFDAGNVGESGVALHLAHQVGRIDLRE